MSSNRLRASIILHHLVLALGWVSVPLYVLERWHYSNEREKFSLALEAADAGRWYWDLQRNELKWDAQMFVLFGQIEKHWTPNYGGFENCLHPEDRERVSALVLAAIANRTGYQDIFRIITASGDVKEIRAAAKVSKDGTYMTGICLPAIHRNGILKAASVGGYPWASKG